MTETTEIATDIEQMLIHTMSVIRSPLNDWPKSAIVENLNTVLDLFITYKTLVARGSNEKT